MDSTSTKTTSSTNPNEDLAEIAGPEMEAAACTDRDVWIHDFDCALCLSLLYDPVTIPCGHTFCRNCLCK
jgi:hypothetical protein